MTRLVDATTWDSMRQVFGMLAAIILVAVGAFWPSFAAELEDISQTETLTLDQTLAWVETYHPLLKAAEIERRIASAKRLEKQGAFDPQFMLENDTQRYNDYINRGTAKEEFLNDATLGMQTRYGATVYLQSSYHIGDIKSPASGTGDAGTHSVGLKLPLLRNARINPKAAEERKALIGEPIANASFEDYRLGFLQKAGNSYWDWVAAHMQVQTYEALLNIAKTRAGQIHRRAEAGDLPLIESVEAKQEVMRRQEQLYAAIRFFEKNTFSFSNYLWHKDGDQLIRPKPAQAINTMPAVTMIDEAVLEQAKLTALQKRPELAQLELLKDVRNVDLALARNQLLPIVDLFAQPGIDLGDRSVGPVFKAGVQITLPLRNRTARGQVEQARLGLEKLNLEQQTLIQQILIEVEDTVSELNRFYQRIQAAQQAYDMAVKLENGERTRYAMGDSTLFLVNQRERATIEALLKLISLQGDYQKARLSLARASGLL